MFIFRWINFQAINKIFKIINPRFGNFKRKIMKIYKPLYWCFIFLVISNVFCSRNISDEDAVKIFEETVRKKSNYCAYVQIDNRAYIVGVCNKRHGYAYDDGYDLYTLINFANNWQTNKMVTFEDGGFLFDLRDKYEIVTIENKKYIYFSLYSNGMGTASGGLAWIHFILYDIIDGKVTDLIYGGAEYSDEVDYKKNKVSGDFENIEEIKDKNLLAFLEQRASISDLIYRKSSIDELDPKQPKNYHLRWELDNPYLVDLPKKVYPSEGKIKFTYYDEKEFSEDLSNMDTIESKSYEIYSNFRGNVIGYDKNLRKYFPILISGCNHGCDKKVSFYKENMIKIYFYFGVVEMNLYVDLSKSTYSTEVLNVLDG